MTLVTRAAVMWRGTGRGRVANAWHTDEKRRWRRRTCQTCAQARGFGARTKHEEKVGRPLTEERSASSVSKMYGAPEVYDAVFSSGRDYASEMDFVVSLFDTHGSPQAAPSSPLGHSAAPVRVLDLGCGTGRHCIDLARRGYQVTGLDSSKPMLDYAKRIEADAGGTGGAGENGAGVDWIEDDLVRFNLPGQKFSIVLVLFGTLSHLTTNADVVSCLRQINQHLEDDGMVVAEVQHPNQLFDIYNELGTEKWDTKVDGSKAIVHYGSEDDVFDARTQVLTRSIRVARGNGEEEDAAGGLCLFEDSVDQRFFTAQEIDLCAQLAGMRVVEMYGDTDIRQILGTQHDDEFRMIICIKKDRAN